LVIWPATAVAQATADFGPVDFHQRATLFQTRWSRRRHINRQLAILGARLGPPEIGRIDLSDLARSRSRM